MKRNVFLGCFGLALAFAGAGLAQRPTTLPILPDPKITPGDALDVTAQDVCTSGYSKKVRNVPQAVKEQVYKNYGILSRGKGEFEVDHLISLELGGSNSIKNLWPESFLTQPWNAHVKDALENELHDEICSGKVDIKIAQQDIARDWIAAYKKYFHTDQPLSKAIRSSSKPISPDNPPEGQVAKTDGTSTESDHTPPADSAGQVWVNTKKGVYWRPGTEYYGKTKKGMYMSEGEAINKGYHAAGEGKGKN